jgi:hypothetical protein
MLHDTGYFSGAILLATYVKCSFNLLLYLCNPKETPFNITRSRNIGQADSLWLYTAEPRLGSHVR